MVSGFIRKVWIHVVVLCQLAVFIPAAQAESVPGTIEVQGYTRSYVLHIPQGYDDRQNVFAAGFSDGASMTFRLAYEMPGQISAIAPVAGYWNMAANTKLSQPVPTMFTIGSDDPIFPLAGGSIHMHWGNWLHSQPTKENLARWARMNGLTEEPQLVGQVGDVRLETYGSKQVFLVCYVQRLGHVWPGTVNQLPQSMMGNENISFDGTAAIWEFFRENRR